MGIEDKLVPVRGSGLLEDLQAATCIAVATFMTPVGKCVLYVKCYYNLKVPMFYHFSLPKEESTKSTGVPLLRIRWPAFVEVPGVET